MKYGACLASALVLLLGCASPEGGADAPGSLAGAHRGDSAEGSPAVATEPTRPVRAWTVAYAEVDGVAVGGYLALPGEGDRPVAALLVIHEWWGLNDNIRAMTRRLAGEGYIALAVDLYGGEVATDPDRAYEMMQAAHGRSGAIEENLTQAQAYLVEKQQALKVATIGWCFGGAWSLNTALLLPDRIDAAVIYYGRLETDPARLTELRMPILGIFGEEDETIPIPTVRAFEAALLAAGTRAEIHVYPGAAHAFANPTGTRYDARAAEDAWERTLEFLGRHLR